jgi:hypothetical protein
MKGDVCHRDPDVPGPLWYSKEAKRRTQDRRGMGCNYRNCWRRLAVSIDKNRLLRSFGTSIRRPDQHRIFDASFVVAARTARLRSRACYAMQRGHDRNGDEWRAARPELGSVD